MPKVVLETFAW